MRDRPSAENARARSGWGKGSLARRFLRREDGTVTVFAAMIFILMISAGGIAVDIMRFETQRAQLQHTLDRAVLAAASLSQLEDPETVVESYFETAGLADYRLSVTVEQGLNFRRVAAEAEMELRTLFMSIFGQRVMTSSAVGTAEERIRNLEVSLVIDISGSMDMDPTYRIRDLRPAARDFVTAVLRANDNAQGEQRASISIIPYSSQVNMGSRLASVFALTDEHDYSRCSRFYADDYGASGIDPAVPIQRMGHFQMWAGVRADPITDPLCPTDDTGAILPWSNSETELHGLIDALRPVGGTAVQDGMRWAVALLDPMARPALNALNAAGLVHEDFVGRPSAHDDEETLKIVVLMTDGENTEQNDLVEQYRDGPSPFWRDPDDGSLSVFYSQWNMYWHEDEDRWRNHPDGGTNHNAVQLDYADLWNHIMVPAVRWDLFHQDSWEKHEGHYSLLNWWRYNGIQAMGNLYEFHDIVETHVRADEADNRLRQSCAVAHARDIVVFAISFDAPSRGETVMRQCASSDAHYYDVDALDIGNAFSSIAQTINQLRLIQ